MKLKNFEIINIFTVLNTLAQQDIKKVTLKYQVGKLIKALSDHVEDFQKARQELVEEYAEKDDEGNLKTPVDKEGNEIEGQVTIGDQKKFNEKMTEISELEVDISLPNKIKIETLEESNIDLSIAELMAIEKIIDQEVS